MGKIISLEEQETEKKYQKYLREFGPKSPQIIAFRQALDTIKDLEAEKAAKLATLAELEAEHARLVNRSKELEILKAAEKAKPTGPAINSEIYRIG